MSLAVVTGGGSGVGRAVALQLASQGTETIIVGRREEALLAVAKENTLIRTCAADIGSEEGRAAVRACVGERPLQLLVQSAAIMPIEALTSTSLSTWRSVMQANVEAPLFLTQELLSNLENADGAARVLLVSSGVADQSVPGLGTYCVSKAGLKMLWKGLSVELQPKGVHVGYCLPGLVDTGMPAAMATTEGFLLKDVMSDRIKNGDAHQPEEVAQWIVALMDETRVDNTLFREREHNVDMAEHSLGLNLTVTTETKMFSAGSADYSQTWDKEEQPAQ